jgi:hypothetical protein
MTDSVFPSPFMIQALSGILTPQFAFIIIYLSHQDPIHPLSRRWSHFFSINLTSITFCNKVTIPFQHNNDSLSRSLSLASSSLCSVCSFFCACLSSPGTLSDYLGALSLGDSTYGASLPNTCLVTSACCLSSSFTFATSPFSFTCALSFCDCVAFFSFSFFLSFSLPFHSLC